MGNKSKSATIADSCRAIAEARGLDYLASRIRDNCFGDRTPEARTWLIRARIRQHWPAWLGLLGTVLTIAGELRGWI